MFGRGISNAGIRNKVDFCAKINILRGNDHFLEVSSNLLVKLTLKEILDTMVVVVTTPVG